MSNERQKPLTAVERIIVGLAHAAVEEKRRKEEALKLAEVRAKEEEQLKKKGQLEEECNRRNQEYLDLENKLGLSKALKEINQKVLGGKGSISRRLPYLVEHLVRGFLEYELKRRESLQIILNWNGEVPKEKIVQVEGAHTFGENGISVSLTLEEGLVLIGGGTPHPLANHVIDRAISGGEVYISDPLFQEKFHSLLSEAFVESWYVCSYPKDIT